VVRDDEEGAVKPLRGLGIVLAAAAPVVFGLAVLAFDAWWKRGGGWLKTLLNLWP
jgi:hypothetical protein